MINLTDMVKMETSLLYTSTDWLLEYEIMRRMRILNNIDSVSDQDVNESILFDLIFNENIQHRKELVISAMIEISNYHGDKLAQIFNALLEFYVNTFDEQYEIRTISMCRSIDLNTTSPFYIVRWIYHQKICSDEQQENNLSIENYQIMVHELFKFKRMLRTKIKVYDKHYKRDNSFTGSSLCIIQEEHSQSDSHSSSSSLTSSRI